MTHSNQVSKIITSLVLGALTGATLGVLFAPRKGRKTRNMIINSTSELTEELKQKMIEKANGLQISVEDVLAVAKTNADIIKHNASTSINALKQTH